MRRIGRWILEEGKRVLGIFAYLWVVFGILILHEHIVLSRHGMSHGFYGLAFLNAWILAKIMLVAERLDVRPHFQGRPLIYAILARSFAFAVLLVCAYALEEMVLGFWRGKTLADSVPFVDAGGILGPVAVVSIMAVALIPYFTFRELGRVLGRRRLRTLLFRDGTIMNQDRRSANPT
ncbi:hypothetical protein F6X51_16735 [Methylobacterium planeticum]|uniref:Uncharacterized protein n=2 Tax=Methylobacterium planeticum TaxID=2615211 RepID=A0A6N6MUB8_9HYPH|nr:hypothetical protein [Methylobacterium planeticum]KAB1072363.1 hypothetical protein F6X51_16735 [Methylobacterium planeticum]